MSEENVEVVKRAWGAWNGGDVSTVLENCDPAIELDTTRYEGWPEDPVYYGHDGFRGFLEEWLASWERFEAGAEKFVDIDDSRVLVLCWQRGLGRDSQVAVQMDYAVMCSLERGLIRRLEVYSDRRVALKAAGLRE